jgi:hypothetical protein
MSDKPSIGHYATHPDVGGLPSTQAIPTAMSQRILELMEDRRNLQERLRLAEAVCEAASYIFCDRFHKCEGVANFNQRLEAWRSFVAKDGENA